MGFFEILRGMSLSEQSFRSKKLWKARARLVLGLLPQGGRLLDVGCFVASQTDSFLARADSTFGIENELKCCGEWSKHWAKRRSRIAIADAAALPFRGGVFSSVVMSEIMEHMQDGGAALQEALRVLEAGGTLVVTVPNRNRMNRRILRALGMNPPTNPLHLHEYSMDEITEKIKSHGFEVKKTTGCGFYWFNFVAAIFPRLAISVVVKAQKPPES
ncbi:MAG: class I SAM-dependent methyltransferase [Candidatus Diapherotrites archaeon]